MFTCENDLAVSTGHSGLKHQQPKKGIQQFREHPPLQQSLTPSPVTHISVSALSYISQCLIKQWVTQFQATARNDFLVSVPCHTASFSDQADVALALHLVFLCFTLDSCTSMPSWKGHDATTSPQGRNRWKGTAAGRSDLVIIPAILSSLLPAFLLSELLWLGEADITSS